MESITKLIVDGFTNLVASVVWFGASPGAEILAHGICVSADRTCTKTSTRPHGGWHCSTKNR